MLSNSMSTSTYLQASVLLCLFITSNGMNLSAQPSNEEFRATWVITWDHINPNASKIENMRTIQNILDDHVAANMNAVIFQVRQSGTAYYNSSYEPWGYYAGYSDPGYDPLEFAIEEAHKRGLELHAWFNVFQTSSTYPGTPAANHPEWICRDQDGNIMNSYRSVSPGLKAVRDYTIDVAMEIVNNYDIDGLHLDYIRWNEHSAPAPIPAPSIEEELKRMDGVISQREIDALASRSGRYLYDYLHPYSAGVPAGNISWENWWRNSVTEFVRSLHDSIQAVKPYVRLSAAVLGKYNWSSWQGYGAVYQDAALWFNRGYVDQLMPMSYHWTTASGFSGMLYQDCPDCWSLYIQEGIDNGNLFSVGPGSYILEENGVWGNHPSIVNACRQYPWVDGFQFFAYSQWQDRLYWTTASHSFFSQNTKIRAQERQSETPSQPEIHISYNDSTKVTLTISPDPNYPWIILYGGLNEEVTTRSQIKEIYFSTSPVEFTESITYLNDDDIIQYAATIANRFWQESPLSNKINIGKYSIPSSITVSSPFPNPTDGEKYSSITYSYPDYHHVSLKIYNLLGEQIFDWEDKSATPGERVISWNGKTNNGNRAATGIYFTVLQLDDQIFKNKIIYLY